MLPSVSAPLLIPPSCRPFHFHRGYSTPTPALWGWCDHSDQIPAGARLPEDCPPHFTDSATAPPNDPRWVAVLVYNLFDFLRFHAVPCNVLHIVVVPLRFQFLEPHARRISRQSGSELTMRIKDGVPVPWMLCLDCAPQVEGQKPGRTSISHGVPTGDRQSRLRSLLACSVCPASSL